MDTFDEAWVLVGVDRGRMKVFGPFPSADQARELANAFGLARYVDWKVTPLLNPNS